jgi:hypothetical protein
VNRLSFFANGFWYVLILHTSVRTVGVQPFQRGADMEAKSIHATARTSVITERTAAISEAIRQ